MKTKKKNYLNNKIVITIVLIIITAIACMPLFLGGIEGHFGQDLGFHLNRIEGLVTELKAGHFPVRMESYWMDGYGYPVSVYYGDILLYIPALLRILGMGVVSAYKCYVFLITYATALATYYCFKKITGRIDIAMICSLIYTLASYRLVNVYIRGAVGEYSAMLFFPIILFAIYKIYKESKDVKVRDQFINASILTLGISGLINTHMLSLEMVGVILIIFCIINFRKTFTKGVLLTYVMAGVEIVIVNLFYIVPFVDYFLNENVNINNVVGNARHIQDSGLHWWEYFSFFKMPFANIEAAGDDRLLLTPGIVCVAILIAGIICWIICRANKEMKITIVSVIILLIICSCYFPWDFLAVHTKVGDFLAQVQFPWRYMGIVIMLLTLLGARVLESIDKKNVLLATYVIIIILNIITVIWFTFEYKKYGDLKTYETSNDLNTSDMGYIEYLRSGTAREEFTNSIETTGNIIVEEIDRNGTTREYKVITSGINGVITLPIVNYKGYEITDKDGNIIEIFDNENNLISFIINGDYVGNIKLSYNQSVYWTIAQIVSLIGVVLLIVFDIIIVYRKKEENKK